MMGRSQAHGFQRAARLPHGMLTGRTSREERVKGSKIATMLGLLAFTFVVALAAEGQEAKPEDKMPANEPDHIKVQHILIGFQGSVPGKNITRSQEEAKKLAYEILERAKKGEEFPALVKEYTDDAYPGIYGMSNKGVSPGQGEYPRDRMVPAFGNTGFPLEVGGIGIADYDPKTSPYGWHIVKRIE